MSTFMLLEDIKSVIGIINPEADIVKTTHRLEEALANYEVNKKTFTDMAKDMPVKINFFISSKRLEGLSEKTLDGYRIELHLLNKYIQKPIQQVHVSDIRGYLASNPEWQIGTISRKISVLKSFFCWLIKEELLLRNPMDKIKLPKKQQRIPKSLTVEELETVRESCQTLRQRAMVEVMYSTGCRLNEIANMKQKDINIQDMSVVVTGKGNMQRVVYLSFKALFHLKKYLKSRHDECEYLFTTERKPIRKMNNRTIQDEINKIEKQSGVDKRLTPHVFRHTFSQLATDAGIELSELQSLLGHADPKTTLVYSTVSEERRKQAHQRYHVM